MIAGQEIAVKSSNGDLMAVAAWSGRHNAARCRTARWKAPGSGPFQLLLLEGEAGR